MRFGILAPCHEAPNGWGPEAKPLARVKRAEPPEAPRFWPYLRTKISILRSHFYFSEFFSLFCIFSAVHDFFLGGERLAMTLVWAAIRFVPATHCYYRIRNIHTYWIPIKVQPEPTLIIMSNLGMLCWNDMHNLTIYGVFYSPSRLNELELKVYCFQILPNEKVHKPWIQVCLHYDLSQEPGPTQHGCYQALWPQLTHLKGLHWALKDKIINTAS